MFALISAIVLFLAAFGVHLSAVNLVILGAAFLALHFAYDFALPIHRP